MFWIYSNASHTAIARRPTSASEIRYAVISPSMKQRCGMIAARNHFPARTGIPRPEGPRAAVASCHATRRHVRACRQNLFIPKKARTTAR
jgi:hypothetical protein